MRQGRLKLFGEYLFCALTAHSKVCVQYFAVMVCHLLRQPICPPLGPPIRPRGVANALRQTVAEGHISTCHFR
ncbi:hypothetical protein BKG76_19200 [Mycobacteroides franklinii]|uniref:Uncharacterized protein n=1 Tax=Mycobacteroides franklinii TaxID=948102 RepID=A0A1S1L604_9MYCO|nr:hypothetical protein BKG76_19200 [Mycobacteroides franklinii]